MNRIERLTAVLLMSQEKSRTSEEIAAHFEVSRHTMGCHFYSAILTL